MNINQYMCNMKVLVGLVTANDTSFEMHISRVFASSTHYYEYILNYEFHDISPIKTILRIITEENQNHIAVVILKKDSDHVIYGQGTSYSRESDTYFEAVDVFLQ